MVVPPPLQVYRIFLSSTDDPIVQEYRRAAKNIIRDEFSLKWQPVDMQDINPSDTQPIEVCKEIILSCHVYIALLGAFYGSVNEQENLSYTEYEFKVAKDSKRKVAVFLLPGEITGIDYDYVALQGPFIPRQHAFRAYVKSEESGLTVREVSSLEDFQKKLRTYLKDLELEPDVITSQPISPSFIEDEKHLNYDRRLIQTYKIEHLDQNLINKFLEQPQAKVALSRAGLLQADTEEHLEILGISRGGRPTLGAFLCLAPRPLLVDKFAACGLHTAIYSHKRRAAAKLLGGEVIADNLLRLFASGMQFLTVRAGLQRIGQIGTNGRDELEIPEVALREVLANALMHRNYEDNDCKDQPTRIEVYPDRVEITSYGRVPEGISVDALNQNPESVSPIRRNHVVAEMFRIMQYAELNASGIGRIHEITQRASLRLPKIIQETKQPVVKVILYRRPQQARAWAGVPLQKERTNVFISSTVRDLPRHRNEVLDACLRQSMFPHMAEQLTVSDADAIRTSLGLVESADVYVGVFAHRYGYMPEGHEISITEMEYDRAVERGITRLVFLMHDNHDIKPSDVELGAGAEKLRRLKARLMEENVVNFFTSPEDLRAHVINSLAQYRERHGKRDLTASHYVSDIPAPPAPYIAHPYTLLQARDLVGRNEELNILTDWVAKPDSNIYGARILSVIAIGGIGKSALIWKWFNDIVTHEMKPLAGRLWWSFYESDAYFENFIIRALAYVTKRSQEDIEQNTKPGEREDQLLAALDREPFLLILDGLERTLTAYARMDANRIADDDLDEQTANYVTGALGLPASAAQSFTGQHPLRKTTDPRAGNFLRKLSRVRNSRILITTRLYPADLQTVTGEPLPGCSALFLRGLNDNDALNLWRALQVTGTREELLQLFHSFGNHPLLIQALASEVAAYRRAPGDFDRWRQNNPDFNPFNLPLSNAQSHVLAFALRGLADITRSVLRKISSSRTSLTYDTLTALLVGDNKPFADENALIASLTELEDRGLLGWDRVANRYDLHPIVRGVVRSDLDENALLKTDD